MKLLFSFSIACFCLFGSLYGDNAAVANACRHLSAACDELAGMCDERCDPAYFPVEKCCFWGDISFYADYLWWFVAQDALHFAITGVDNNVAAEGELFALTGDWDSGFRLGAAVLFPCNAWRGYIDWLRFRSEENDGVITNGLTLRATRGNPGGIDVIAASTATFNFKLDTVRGGISVPLFTRTHVAISPCVSIRADWVSEDFNVIYEGAVDGTFSNTLHYWGVGPEFGLKGSWYLLPCFSFFGDIQFAGLYGDSDSHQERFVQGGGEEVNVRMDINKLQTTLSVSTGVQWEGVFFRNIFLAFCLGWETNIWYNLNSVLNFTDAGVEGNLGNFTDDLRASGVTGRVTLSF